MNTEHGTGRGRPYGTTAVTETARPCPRTRLYVPLLFVPAFCFLPCPLFFYAVSSDPRHAAAPGRRCWRLGRKRPSPFQTHSGPTHSAALRPGFNLRYIVLSFLSFWHQLSAEGLPGQKHVAKRTFARVSRIKGPPLRCEHIAAVIISGIPGSFCTHALRAPIHEMRLVSHGHASIKCPLKSRDAKTLRPSEVSKLREAMDIC